MSVSRVYETAPAPVIWWRALVFAALAIPAAIVGWPVLVALFLRREPMTQTAPAQPQRTKVGISRATAHDYDRAAPDKAIMHDGSTEAGIAKTAQWAKRRTMEKRREKAGWA